MKARQRDGTASTSSAVRALEAGVDALIVGHDLGEDDRRPDPRGARRARVAEGGCEEAAGRIASLAAWAQPAAATPIDRRRGAGAAERCRRSKATSRSSGAPAIVELRPAANIAAGEAEHGLGARVVREGEPIPRRGRVRRARRAPSSLDAEAADVPGAVVVETGLPVWRPQCGARLRRRRTAAVARRSTRSRRCSPVTTPPRARAARAAGGARAPDRDAARQRRADRGALPPRRRQYVLIASRGSSSNAARYAQYVLGRAHRVPVAFATPSLYTLYGQPPRLDGALVARHLAVRRVAGRRRRCSRRRSGRAGRRSRSRTTRVAARGRGRRGARARSGRGAGGRRDQDVPQLARRDRAAVRGDDRRRGGAARARAHSRAVALQLERRGTTRSGSTGSASYGGTVVARGVNYATAYEIALKIRELSGCCSRRTRRPT